MGELISETCPESCDACDNTEPVLGCTDSDADNYNALATEDDGSCEYPTVEIDWNEGLPDTDCNATILVQSSTDITINGETISNGDIIGVFYTNANGDLSLGGVATWTGSTTSIAAWGAEAGWIMVFSLVKNTHGMFMMSKQNNLLLHQI